MLLFFAFSLKLPVPRWAVRCRGFLNCCQCPSPPHCVSSAPGPCGKAPFPALDGPHSAGWREHMERRRRFEFDFRERDDERGYRRVRCGSGSMDDDRDSLPEWCLEDAEEEMGTFDSSGAFLSLKVKSCFGSLGHLARMIPRCQVGYRLSR